MRNEAIKMMKRILPLVFGGIILPVSAFSAALTARVDNPKIAYGETINFHLSYDGSDGGNLQPDLSVLQKDFNIYSTSSSMNTSIINGVATQKREWVITLLPQNQGKQIIPSVSAGNYKSSPVEIEVLSSEAIKKEQKNSVSGNDAAVQMASFEAELKADNKNPYVEQEISVVLTIRSNQNLQFSNEPYFEDGDDWIIKRVSNSDISQKDGEIITKLNYVFFPQKSGKQKLPRAVIEGFYVTYENSPKQTIGGGLLQLFDMDMGSMFGVQKPVLFKSNSEIINVKPIPQDYTAQNWVPADILVADAKWVDAKPNFKVGETVAREIMITASGVFENQLPELEFTQNSAWKQYPDKPQYSSTIHENKLISQEIIRVVYIPQKSGKIQLPEIVIPWFNVKTQKTEKAVIPAENVEVKPNAQYEALQSEPMVKQVLPEKTIDIDKPEKEPVLPEKITDKSMIIMAVVIAFLSGLLISFLMFGRKKDSSKTSNINDYHKNVRNALTHGDFRGARDGLVKWGQSIYPQVRINNLQDLSAAIADEEFSKQCKILNAILYGNSTAEPDISLILKSMGKHTKHKDYKQENILPNLYK